MGYKVLYGYYQYKNMSKESYILKKYYYEVVNHSGGQVGQHPILIDQKLRKAGLDPETAS